MWRYVKMLQYPVNIKNKNLFMAKQIIAQYGGPQGELGAAIRYLNQRITMPDERGKALLTDIGTEELGHVEMLQAMFYQMTKDATIDELIEAGLAGYYTEHGKDIFPENPSGVPFSAGGISSVGDPIANLVEDMAAEKKAKAVYEHLIELTDDNDIIQPLLFLRQREVVHYERFKELMEYYQTQGY